MHTYVSSPVAALTVRYESSRTRRARLWDRFVDHPTIHRDSIIINPWCIMSRKVSRHSSAFLSAATFFSPYPTWAIYVQRRGKYTQCRNDQLVRVLALCSAQSNRTVKFSTCHWVSKHLPVVLYDVQVSFQHIFLLLFRFSLRSYETATRHFTWRPRIFFFFFRFSNGKYTQIAQRKKNIFFACPRVHRYRESTLRISIGPRRTVSRVTYTDDEWRNGEWCEDCEDCVANYPDFVLL